MTTADETSHEGRSRPAGPDRPAGPLAGIRVLDLGTVYAAPIAAMLLGDYGAEVVKVEHPQGDPARTHGHSKDGHGLWWKVIARNKRTVTLDLGRPAGQEILRRLAAIADVVIENFRPGVMERWGLGPDELLQANPGLVMLRVTGFGQFGPYAERRAFGTLAEAMSGFAHQCGLEDGPPTLPPFGLADGVAGISGALAVMLALYSRDAGVGGERRGQVIDLSLLEPLLGILGPGPTVYDQLGIIPGRHGNRSPNNAPRNAYLTRDERWVAISASATSVAERVMRLVGRPDIAAQPWFSSAGERVRRGEMIDHAVATWIRGTRPRRRDPGLRGRRRRPGPDLRRRGAHVRPPGGGPRRHHHRRRRGSGPAAHAEHHVPTAGHSRWYPLQRPPARAGHRGCVLRVTRAGRREAGPPARRRSHLMYRSFLFAPGHNAKLLGKVFDAGADAVILDLEDAVPPESKAMARRMVAEAIVDRPAWVRVNAAGSDECAADLDAIADRATGIRIPKVESARDVEWVASRCPATTPLICAIESARGVLAALEIASAPGVRHLSMGGVDLQRDLNAGHGILDTLYAALAPGPVLPGRRPRPTNRQRLPPPRRRPRLTPTGTLRPLARVLRQVGHPPPAAGRAARGVHTVEPRAGVGP